MKVCILGAGAFGLALASIFSSNKNYVTVWSHTKKEASKLKTTRKSEKLKDYIIPKKIKITANLSTAVKKSNLVVIAVPAHALNDVTIKLSKHLNNTSHLLIATKGIEQDTCAFLTEVVERNINTNKLAVISGPSFAVDIIKEVPIGFSLGVTNVRTKNLIKNLMENENIKLRETPDILGVEVCGAIKNVMAIASGMLEGMKVTDSTKALFLTEALNDIKELIDALGGNKKTILSFAGFGDILMTCTSTNSRNFNFGKLIGEGKLEKAEEYAKNTTVEGLYTLKSIKELIKREHVKMEVVDLISDIIMNKKEKEEILEFLITK